RLMVDGRAIRNPNEHVTIQIFSPLQRIIAPEISSDDEMKHRSLQDPNTFFLRTDDVPAMRRALVRAAATADVAEQVLSTSPANDPERDVAKLAKNHDVGIHKLDIHYYMAQAVRNGVIFFRGSAYYPTDGDNATTAIRNVLS